MSFLQKLGKWGSGTKQKNRSDKITAFAEKLAVAKLNTGLEDLRGARMEIPLSFALLYDKQLEGELFCLEHLLVQTALEKWLVPTGQGRAGSKGRKLPSEKFALSSGVDPTQKEEILQDKKLIKMLPAKIQTAMLLQMASAERNGQFTTELIALDIEKTTRRSNETFRQIEEKRVATECYISKNGLLPLVWAEILYAVKNDIFARSCKVCGNWFPLTKGKYNQIYCSTGCLSKSKRKLNNQFKNKRAFYARRDYLCQA